MSRFSSPPAISKRSLRNVVFVPTSARFKTSSFKTPSFVVVACCFAFFAFASEAFGQTYSSEKEAWNSARPKVEPSATSSSDVASKRASVLLSPTKDDVSKSRKKSRSKAKTSSLKTYRPTPATSSLISSSSFSEKKADLSRSSKKAFSVYEENLSKQYESADKEKLFGEMARRDRVNLGKEYEETPGLASFELTEPISESESREDFSPAVPRYPIDSQSSLSVSINEEIENAQDARKNLYNSELELYGSASESDDEENVEEGDEDFQAPTLSTENDFPEIETINDQIDETLASYEEDSNVQEENLDVIENDLESPETEIDAPTVSVGELEFETSEESVNESVESALLEDVDATETEAQEASPNVETDASVKELESSLANEAAFEDSLLESDASVVDSEESDDAGKDSTQQEETGEEESDVPKTGSVSAVPDRPRRYAIPAESFLSFDDKEPKIDNKSASAKAVDEIQREEQKKSSRSLEAPSPKTFVEESEDEEENESSEDEVKDLIVPKEVESVESSEKEGDARQIETVRSIREELNVDKNATQEYLTSAPQETRSKSDEGLFPKLRALQRNRQRLLFNGRLLEAPTPPSIDDLDPEIVNQKTAPPLLTKENANLPSLDVETVKAYKPELESVETEKLQEEMKKFSWTKGAFTITPYGFLNLSVAADTQRSTPGEFILYVQSPDVDESAGFSVDARTSRLGLDIVGPRIEALSADVNGKVEFDFQGTVNGSKNKGGLQLRRAYVELVDKQHERKFLAGQDWEIISPVAPQVLNYLPLGFVGDMQYRRAQVRFEQGWTCSSDLHVLGQIAVCDNVLGDYVSTSGVNAATSGWPVLEARVSSAFFGEARGGLPITFGVSGHIGEQNYKFSALAGVPMASTTVKRAIKTWSVNFDLDAPITKTQKIQGELFTGSNLSTFCGGINQGIDLIRREGIRSTGGWLAWHSDWTEKIDVNFGYGIDKPNEKDLVGTSSPSNGYATARTQNQVYFVNGIYNWTPNFMTGLETSFWQTDYQKADLTSETPVFYDMRSGKSTRIEFVTRLSF